jgi:hypothetical protein
VRRNSRWLGVGKGVERKELVEAGGEIKCWITWLEFEQCTRVVLCSDECVSARGGVRKQGVGGEGKLICLSWGEGIQV